MAEQAMELAIEDERMTKECTFQWPPEVAQAHTH